MIDGEEIRINLKIQRSVTPELYEMVDRLPRNLRAEFVRHKLAMVAFGATTTPLSPRTVDPSTGDTMRIVSAIGADFLR